MEFTPRRSDDMVTEGKKCLSVSAVTIGAPEVQVDQLLASNALWLCQGERHFGWAYDCHSQYSTAAHNIES